MNDQDRLEEVERALREHILRVDDLFAEMVRELSMRLEVSEERIRELIEEQIRIRISATWTS